ncbi:hypothetical protein [Pseudorhodoplanes sp.]|uniref:hypothetical protein n=1 Tax=Pseudorhodoplanes sp. TaxID=1934341 RepID=UPI0039199425
MKEQSLAPRSARPRGLALSTFTEPLSPRHVLVASFRVKPDDGSLDEVQVETLILILLAGGLLYGALALIFRICMAFDRGDGDRDSAARRRS